MTCQACAVSKKTAKGMGGMPMLENALNGSPVLQYAWELGLPFVPFHLNLRVTWEEGSPVTTDVVSFENSKERLNVASIIDQVSYQIDAPNYNANQSTKPISDWYFQRQSGIQAQMIIAGAPRYVVAPFFTPIETLMSTLAEGWPRGWVLEYTQSVTMQFTQAVPLPSFPTTLTITFRLWQPGSGQALDLVGLTNAAATEKLAQLRAGNPQRTPGI